MKLTDKIRSRLKKRYPLAPGPSPAPPPPAAPPIPLPVGDVVVADGRAWVRVRGSKPWRPTRVGEVLVGELVGRGTRPCGGGNVYGIVTLRTAAGTRTVAGVVVTDLFESAGCAPGAAVRLVYRGDQTSQAGRTWRDFDLYLAKDEVGG